MIVESQRGEICPIYGCSLGDLPCKKCIHWRSVPRRDEYEAEEYCDLILFRRMMMGD